MLTEAECAGVVSAAGSSDGTADDMGVLETGVDSGRGGRDCGFRGWDLLETRPSLGVRVGDGTRGNGGTDLPRALTNSG